MGFFDGILKGIGNIASVAAPFLPGPWGAVAGAAGSLISSGQRQKQADAQTGKMNQAIDQYGQFINQQSQIDPAQYWQQALANVGQNNAAIYGQGIEATDPAYDSAVMEMGRDVADRGVGGSAYTGQVANIRTNQARQNAGIMRDIGINNINQRGDIYNQIAQANMQRLPFLMQGQQSLLNARLGHMGGLQGLYQSQANQGGNALGQLAGALGQAGAFDWFKKKPSNPGQAGGSGTFGSTSAQSATPTPPFMGGGGSNTAIPQTAGQSMTGQEPVNVQRGLWRM